MTIAKNLIESTGFYTTDCREWNRTDKDQKTWVNFKVHYSRVFRETRGQSRQAQHAGYGQSKTQDSANTAMFAEKFEAFVQQTEDRKEAVALQNPYTDIQIVTIAENLIESTGFLTMDCREWNRTDKDQKTWVNFKVHFSRTFRENRDQSRQAQHAGYGQSNTQDSANAAIFAEMTQDHSHALANLATATQSDRYTVANMSKTIADLTL